MQKKKIFLITTIVIYKLKILVKSPSTELTSNLPTIFVDSAFKFNTLQTFFQRAWIQEGQLQGTWASMDFGIYGGSLNQSPEDTEDWMYLLLHNNKLVG